MDETKRRRLAGVRTAFAAVVAYVTFADGLTADLGDLLGVLLILLGAALAYTYCANPGEVLSFGTGE